MDKLLNGIKDFSTIAKYFEIINQTTDDFLFIHDMATDKVRFFGNIGDYFEIDGENGVTVDFDDVLAIMHHADNHLLAADIDKVRRGESDGHNMDFRMINRQGATVWVNSRGKVLHDENGNPRVTIGRLSEEAVRHLFNPLTGLWNTTRLRQDLNLRLHSGKGWLMKLGIPSLTDINLTHGKDFGNKILCEIAELLETIDQIEASYHTDHNNLAVIISECDAETVEAIYERVSMSVSEKCTVFAGVVPIDDSIFIDVSQLTDSANVTLRDAEQNPMGRAELFSVEEIDKRINELTLLEELKESVQNGFEGFEINYQPQIKRVSYDLYGVEALLRYNSSQRGRVFPDQFIPILERSGLMEPVGMWVLERALEQCKKWREDIPDLCIAVNFSSVQFEDARLGERVIAALKKVGLPGAALTMELTESVRLNEKRRYFDQIKYIKSYGVRFSVDDFGTGYSNLAYLKQFEVNEIKIDRSFVTEIEENTYNYHLISNIMDFACANSIHICCEGVETPKELSVLEPLKVDVFQGYLFDKPCPAEEIEKKYIYASSDKYGDRINTIDEIRRFKETFGSIHFNPENILHENDIGLWIIRANEKNHRYELHVDAVMERILGLEEKLSPEKCFDYWFEHISRADTEYVVRAFKVMAAGGKAVQLEYQWDHPSVGTVAVRSSGIRTQDANGTVMLEGYHKILTGVEGA